MPTEHSEIDVDAQLRAFAVALEAHTAEPIRPVPRPVADDERDPVVVEPSPMPPSPDRRRWVLPAVAAAVIVLALVAGLVVLTDNTNPSDTPPSTTATPPTTTTTTTPDDEAQQPSPADLAVISGFFAAYNGGDIGDVLALVADELVLTEQYGGAPPNPTSDPFPNPDQQLAWKHAQGETITEPTCVTATRQPAAGATLSCEYTTLDAFVQAIDGTPIPTRTLFTIVDGEIVELHQGYGPPDYSALASQFRRWIEQNHPDMFDALFADWTTRDEAVRQGQLRAEWAQEWARSVGDTSDGQATPAEPQPVTQVTALAAPVGGQTQQSIVGELAWTRVDTDITTGPTQISFKFDDVFYGNRLGFFVDGAGAQPQWWRSDDGVAWTPWAEVPPDTRLYVVGDTIWAESSSETGSPPELRFWDGTAVGGVEFPPSAPAPGEGLSTNGPWLFVEADFDGEIVVRRVESFGVPWDKVLGIEPPLEAVEQGGSWEETFSVRALECTTDFGGRSCVDDGSSATWVIRPEIVEGTPARINLYDDDTGELITSVMPPDDGRPIDDVLFGLGFENSVGIRTDYLVADGDGTNGRVVDWPFERADFAELGGRLFALTGRFDQELELWVTDDLKTWDQLAVPAGIAQDGFSSLVSDGSTMVLSTVGPFGPEGPLVNQPMWITTDGITWTARVTALVGHETWGPDATEFGWIEFHDAHSGDDAVNSSPSIAISADAETWQIVPIPIPAALADSGLTWADANSDDGTIGWEWDVFARGDTIFVILRSNTVDRAQELWVGRVDKQ